MWSFFVGLFIGGIFGFIIAALCKMAGDDDDESGR